MTTRRTDLTHVPQFWCLRTVGWPLVALALASGVWFADRQAQKFDTMPVSIPESESGSELAVSAIYQGLTAKGDYYSCVRPPEIRPQHPAYKRLLEACVLLPQPDTLVSR